MPRAVWARKYVCEIDIALRLRGETVDEDCRCEGRGVLDETDIAEGWGGFKSMVLYWFG